LNLASFPTGIAASNLDKKQIYLILNNYEESTKDSHHMEELLEITREGLSSTSPKTTMVPFGGHLFWPAACLQVVICLRKLVLAASPLMLSTFFRFLVIPSRFLVIPSPHLSSANFDVPKRTNFLPVARYSGTSAFW
jgi:hypothetical protein